MTDTAGKVPPALLDECSQLLIEGESIAGCLARYPRYATALAPLLETIVEFRAIAAVPPRQPEVAARSRAQFMAALQVTMQPVSVPATVPDLGSRLAAGWAAFLDSLRVLRPVPYGLVAALVLVLTLGVLTTGAITASAHSLPGDALYPVKLAAEQARVILAVNPQARVDLAGQIAAERVEEAQAILQMRRAVTRMPLAGEIESVGETEWRVSGLTILVDANTRIAGIPAAGARVHGYIQAPGDGSLVALELVVEPGTPAAIMLPTSTSTAKPLPTATRRSPTITPSRSPRAPALAVPTWQVRRPTEDDSLFWSPIQPTATQTAGATPIAATFTPTRVITATATATPTIIPAPTQPRPEVRARIIGFVVRVDGTRWTIDEVTVDTDGHTEFIDNPGVGDRVNAELLVREDGSYLALKIRQDNPAAPEPYEAVGILESMDGPHWTIGGTVVVVTEAQIEGDPHTGDMVEVDGERRGGEIWAMRIRRVVETVEFSGPYGGSVDGGWIVGGTRVIFDGQTKRSGPDPDIDWLVHVRGILQLDGSVLASMVHVEIPVTPEPSPEVSPEPSPEVSPEPSPEVSPEPSPEVSPEPSPEVSPEPSPEVSPEPSPEVSLEPSPEVSPEPSPSDNLPPVPVVGTVQPPSIDPPGGDR